MKLRQLQEMRLKITNKKIAALLIAASGVVGAAGFELVNVSVKVGLELLFVFAILFMMGFIAFTWNDTRQPEQHPPKIKDPRRQPKD